jgi:hypothetical protein
MKLLSVTAHHTERTQALFAAFRLAARSQAVRIRVRGRCMEPLVPDGAWVDVDGPSRFYWPGDVVVLAIPQGPALHRVIGGYLRGGQWQYLTQADAASWPDNAVAPAQILGKARGGDCSPLIARVPLHHRLHALGRFLRFCVGRVSGTRVP